jgi:hypothetical protein
LARIEPVEELVERLDGVLEAPGPDKLGIAGFDLADDGAGAPTIHAALDRLKKVQRPDGTFGFKLVRGKDKDLPWWICLAVCRSLKRWQDAATQSS